MMVRYERYGIPADVNYGLDHMTWVGDITGDVYDWAMNFEPNIAKIYDEDYRADNLKKHFEKWFDGADFESKLIVTYHAMTHMIYQSSDAILALTNSAIEYAEDMPNNDHILMAWNKDPEIQGFKKNLYHSIQKFKQVFFPYKLEYYDIIQEMKLERETAHKEFALQMRDEMNEILRIKTHPKQPKEKKKMMTKSINLFESFFGKENRKIFLASDYITITGSLFDYKIKKNNMNAMNSHGLSISIHEKETNEKLANSCFYYENTPVPDQAVAFLLDITAGNEELFLKTGNLSSLSPKGVELLSHFKPRKELTIRDIFGHNEKELRRINLHDTVKANLAKPFVFEFVNRKLQPLIERTNQLLIPNLEAL